MKTQFNISLTILGTVLSLLCSTSYAGQATIPNTFVSGTAANAAEVNENFNALQSAINDNDVRIIEAAKRLVAVDATDTVIGLVSGGEAGEPYIMSPQGFHTKIFGASGTISTQVLLYYTDVDCGNSGSSTYVDYSNSANGNIVYNLPAGGGGQTTIFSYNVPAIVNGAVYTVADPYFPTRAPAPDDDWYLPKSPTLVSNLAPQSLKLYYSPTDTVDCLTVSSGILSTAAEVLPNDVAVTGIPNNGFPSPPIRVDYR
ncbi:MAG: hypothetical protein ACC707_12990 [Thiohalomonadales bacterium]